MRHCMCFSLSKDSVVQAWALDSATSAYMHKGEESVTVICWQDFGHKEWWPFQQPVRLQSDNGMQRCKGLL